MKLKIAESFLEVWIRDYYAVPVPSLIVRTGGLTGTLIVLPPVVSISLNPLSLVIHPMETPTLVSSTGMASFPASNMFLGEQKQIGINVSRGDGNTIEFESVTYRIYDIDGTSQGDEDIPQITGSNIFIEIPASVCGRFYVEFTVTVNTTICKARRTYQVIR